MLLTAASPTAVPQVAPPDWVAEWLSKREETKTKREEKALVVETEDVDDPARAEKRQAQANKAAAKRTGLVAKGIDGLHLWFDDLMRSGLAGVELKPASFWENQAARMVDAQASGVATRLRGVAGIPNSGPDWPDRLLAELGRIALLTHAYERIDALDAPLQDDVRAMIGWSLKEDDVVARGESVSDEWIALGELVTNEDRLRVSRTWLLGTNTRRTALVLQFAVAGAGFEHAFVTGTRQQATMIYWPSAYPQRALVREREATLRSTVVALPGHNSIAEFLDEVARALASQPWLERFPCVVRNVTPAFVDQRWLIQDSTGTVLPLVDGTHWKMLALSGGKAVDFAAEWDGIQLRPLGMLAAGQYHPLPEVDR